MTTGGGHRVEGSAATGQAALLLAALLPVAVEVEDGGFLAFLGQQAEAAGDFLIGFGFAAEALAEAVLVELLVRLHVPQAAAVGADLVGEDDAGVVVFPQPAEFELEVDQADADRRRTCRT